MNGHRLQAVADEADLQLDREGRNGEQKLPVKIGCDPCCGAFDDDVSGENRFSEFRVNYTATQHFLSNSSPSQDGDTD